MGPHFRCFSTSQAEPHRKAVRIALDARVTELTDGAKAEASACQEEAGGDVGKLALCFIALKYVSSSLPVFKQSLDAAIEKALADIKRREHGKAMVKRLSEHLSTHAYDDENKDTSAGELIRDHAVFKGEAISGYNKWLDDNGPCTLNATNQFRVTLSLQ